ncbi:4-hydroxythreonine-4-phosphate dehydrogenase PdxA [Chitinivibrio alkaliphilus]|uniref:4-hydroxythreonine-4-phosphate dehydrogenase n=1 Tax=Chitinivibrio alkaliphilus ACht1 TaxID=1313304 RepID=U7D9R5_9BACT|nr:4-hydroxythreonine-4-phosphate dehydrogenase PdxA [Chitinivibrio alkaliphilus]ERP39139.1 4-hydroxythreonine-4-phosphate dehydrogenase [Chitinivibrio alkaliphilus ACht1]
MTHPPIAITMGDPAGIGPEIILKFFSKLPTLTTPPLVIGSMEVLSYYAACLTEPAPPLQRVTDPQEIQPGVIPVLEQDMPPFSWKPGILSKECGAAAYSYICRSIELAQSQQVSAVVTAPINKEALHMAGIAYPGHTEIFAEKTGCSSYTMMFSLDGVSVVHVTSHCSLREALDKVKPPLVLSNIRLLHQELCLLGIDNPRIAVSGLNPHAGENRIFGNEDYEHILPAVTHARKEGMAVVGPLPPDTVFMNAFKGEFDGVVSMLHDHGFVALKSRDFERGVNVTIGLPIIRTSVGHGTAFGIAGKNCASPESLCEAYATAEKLTRSRKE